MVVSSRRIDVSSPTPTGSSDPDSYVVIGKKDASYPNSKNNHYQISVYTANTFCAGTDSNIYIKLLGTIKPSAEHHLKKSINNKDPFERGHEDKFDIYEQDLGYITHIEVRSDMSGMSAGWLLNKIVVKNLTPRHSLEFEEYTFIYRKWFLKDGKKDVLVTIENSSGLPIANVDPMIKENSYEHHTDKFQLQKMAGSLILRRGQSFKIKVKLGRKYIPETDQFFFNLKTGKNPQSFTNSDITVPQVTDKEFKAGTIRGKEWMWKAILLKVKDSDTCICEIFIPPNAVPGKYTFSIESEEECVFKFDKFLFILFNPWCQADEVYMDDKEELKEYVIRQTGSIYVGSYRHPRPMRWYFGQFEEISLLVAIQILEDRKTKGREDPVNVARYMTSMVNSLDNKGILVGNWSGDYVAGRKPSSWISSTAILEHYLEFKNSVKFGQCWVFSGVLTTLMRTLGIPCRSVTNFCSAHDTKGNCTMDTYLDENGDEIKVNGKKDSIWNFHVWNDIWMTRPDLAPGHGGWQAIDATPQEVSGGFYQMGPASLKAVKEGDIGLNYDTAFCLAEVNADHLYWEQDAKNGSWQVVQRETDTVGKLISTKAVGRYARHDITDLYKFPEGSILERASVKNAMTTAGNAAVKITKKDVELKIEPSTNYVRVGDDAIFDLVMKNLSTDERNITFIVGGQFINYNGICLSKLELHPENDRLGAEKDKKVRIKIPAMHYTPHLNEDVSIKFIAIIKVLETEQFIRSTSIIDVRKPVLKFENPPIRIPTGDDKEHELEVTFENPLDVRLTELEMYMDGTVIPNRVYVRDMLDLKPHQTLRQAIRFKPVVVSELKKKKIMVSLATKELGGIHGNIDVELTGSGKSRPDPKYICGTTW